MSIPFTQYLLPDGRKKIIEIDLDEIYGDAANMIIDSGCVFEIEILNTGHISMTISDDEDDLFIEVCNNGPDVPIRVMKMIDDFKKDFL